jgi:hypothetical protein
LTDGYAGLCDAEFWGAVNSKKQCQFWVKWFDWRVGGSAAAWLSRMGSREQAGKGNLKKQCQFRGKCFDGRVVTAELRTWHFGKHVSLSGK